MAFCPICKTSAPWWKVIFLSRWTFMICKTCGTTLRTNKKRALTILLIFSIPMLIAAYMQSVGLISRNDMIPLAAFLIVLLPFSWDLFTKLEAIPNNSSLLNSSSRGWVYFSIFLIYLSLKLYLRSH